MSKSLLVAILCGSSAAGAAEHPFMLWTAREAAAIRQQVATADWAKAAAAAETNNLVRYGILGENAAGAAEKKELLADLARGEVATIPNAFRYDVLHDLLTVEERAAVKAAFVRQVEAQLARVTGAGHWRRANWLPNLEYVGYTRLAVVAAATGDAEFIRKVFGAPQGLKWYFDEYLSDTGFYNEEFGKGGWMYEPFAQWCWAMERLGLDELGWGYRGRQGATFRGCIESMIQVGYPRVDLDRPCYHYGRVSMGDARGGGSGLSGGPVAIFQHRLIGADLEPEERTQKGLSASESYARALEFLHAKWPAAGYGYFLVQHRRGGAPYPLPLRFGLTPIPANTAPPPGPSAVYPGRGLVMLRAEEGPAYWESPAPAVSLRLATPYAHHVQDSFALAGFYGFNRPLFVNHSHPTGYTGTDPDYSNSIRSHSGLMVDQREPAFLSQPVAVRHEFGPQVKFVAARGKGIFPGVDQTRALLLTREYLLDVSHLVSATTRDYLWQIHTFGQACPDNPTDWAASGDLLSALPDLGNERSCATDGTWTVTAVQTSGTQNEKFSRMGPRWFQDRVGVRVTMLGEPGTRAYTAWAPVVSSIPGDWRGRNRFAYGEDEPAGVAIVATRRAAATTFAAVHEPFRTTYRIRSVRRVAQDARGLVVAVHGDTFTDYLMLRFGDAALEPVTMGQGDETFMFRDYGYVRVTGAKIEQAGNVTFQRQPVPLPATVRAGPIAARFQPPSALCLPTGGTGTRTLKLRNNGPAPVTLTLPVTASKGLSVAPARIELREFAPGAETNVVLAVDATGSATNALHRVEVTGPNTQPATLRVAHGVATDGRSQVADEFCQTVFGPRYVATYWFMESGGALELLDPAGFRRHNTAGMSYPSVATRVPTDKGGARWELAKAGRYPYFIPIVVERDAGGPRELYDHGQHVHGFSGDLAHWFAEDWIVVRHRRAKTEELVSFDWDPRGGYRSGLASVIPGRDPKLSAERLPGTAFVVDDKGAKHLLAGKGGLKGGVNVRAMYVRPDGYEHGAATFYPPETTWLDGRVAQPGQTPMAFSFCTDAEFPVLLAKWLAAPHTGEPSPADVQRNRGAFGATISDPE